MRVAAACFTLFCTMPAAAHARIAGGWEILAGSDYCMMQSTFEGPGDTELAITKDLGGDFAIIASNKLWSAKDGARYKVEYILNEKSYSANALASAEYTRSGFGAKFGPAVETDIVEGSSITMYLDGRFIRKLSLSGTRVAMFAVNECLRGVRQTAAAAERERQRWADIPRDPFAQKAAPAEQAPPALVSSEEESFRKVFSNWQAIEQAQRPLAAPAP